MTNTLKIQKRITLLSLIVIVVSIALWLAWIVVADTVIEAAFNGESLPLVNKYVSIHKSIDPANRTLEYFLTNGKPVVPRLLGLIIAGNILFLIGLRYGRSLLKNFFSEPTHPVNLAIFRIVLFAAIIGYLDVAQVVQFSGFPPDLRVAPFGLGWILNSIPINPLWARATSYAFILACAAGCLGFFSRTSALLATVLGMYVLGIPQFFGKIDHYHHLLWFTALLAASPCGDVLSIDALIGARRKGIWSRRGSIANRVSKSVGGW